MRPRLIVLLLLVALAAGFAVEASRPGHAGAAPCAISLLCGTTTTTPVSPPTTEPGSSPGPAGPSDPATTTTPAATVRPHGRYDGEVSPGGRTTVITDANGTHITTLHASFIPRGRCSDGSSFENSATVVFNAKTLSAKYRRLNGPAPVIDPSENATYSRTLPETIYSSSGKRLRLHKASLAFAMTAHLGATEVTGTVHATLTAGRLHCDSGIIHYTAFRDGTPQAPERTATIVTGTYAAPGVKADVFVPELVVRSLTVPRLIRCTGEPPLTRPVTFLSIGITGRRFSSSYSAPPTDLRPGATGHLQYKLTGVFNVSGSRYSVTLRHRSTSYETYHGHTTRCTDSYSGTAYLTSPG